MDTCKNLASLTGEFTEADCDPDFTDDDINNVLATVKRGSQFFSSKTFMAND